MTGGLKFPADGRMLIAVIDQNLIPDCFLLFNEVDRGSIWLNRLAIACFAQQGDGTVSFFLFAPAANKNNVGLKIRVCESLEEVKKVLSERLPHPESSLCVKSPYPSWTATNEFTLGSEKDAIHVNPLAVACLRTLEDAPFHFRTEIRFIHASTPLKVLQPTEEVAIALNKSIRGMFVPA